MSDNNNIIEHEYISLTNLFSLMTSYGFHQ